MNLLNLLFIMLWKKSADETEEVDDEFEETEEI